MSAPLHEHEDWQVREGPDGRRYCAACGDTVCLDVEAGYWKTTM